MNIPNYRIFVYTSLKYKQTDERISPSVSFLRVFYLSKLSSFAKSHSGSLHC